MTKVKNAFYLRWRDDGEDVLSRFKECGDKDDLLRLVGETVVICLNLPRPKKREE